MRCGELSPVLMALASDPRLGMVVSLAESSKDVGALAEAMAMERSHVSKHLQCLRWADLVKYRREKKLHIYSLARSLQVSHTEIGCVITARNAVGGSATLVVPGEKPIPSGGMEITVRIPGTIAHEV